MKRLVAAVAISCIAATLMVAQGRRRRLGSARLEAAFSVVEATIPEMRAAMEQGRVTARELVLAYLVRIAWYDNKLHAAITVNRDALKEAGERDHERAQGRIRGPLSAGQL